MRVRVIYNSIRITCIILIGVFTIYRCTYIIHTLIQYICDDDGSGVVCIVIVGDGVCDLVAYSHVVVNECVIRGSIRILYNNLCCAVRICDGGYNLLGGRIFIRCTVYKVVNHLTICSIYYGHFLIGSVACIYCLTILAQRFGYNVAVFKALVVVLIQAGNGVGVAFPVNGVGALIYNLLGLTVAVRALHGQSNFCCIVVGFLFRLHPGLCTG